MKNLLTLVIVLASTTAFAARSRVTALGNAAHVVDVSTVYSNPSDMMVLSDSLTIESGNTNATTTTNGAEALLIRSMGDAKLALSLGHDDATVMGNRTAAATVSAPVITQQNPFELSYGTKVGDMAVAGTLVYSNFNDKAAESKESSTSLRLGAQNQLWKAAITLGLADKTTSGTGVNADEYKGKSNVALSGGYWVSSEMYAFANVANTGYELTDAATVVSDVKGMSIQVGAVNTMKKDGNEFFWGASLLSTNEKDSKVDTKTTTLTLPVVIGMEADAASWLTLRGSISQSVMIQDEKTTDATSTISETSPGANSTTFAAGAGLKLGKLVVDGSILTGGAQNVDAGAGNLLTTVGMTYSF